MQSVQQSFVSYIHAQRLFQWTIQSLSVLYYFNEQSSPSQFYAMLWKSYQISQSLSLVWRIIRSNLRTIYSFFLFSLALVDLIFCFKLSQHIWQCWVGHPWTKSDVMVIKNSLWCRILILVCISWPTVLLLVPNSFFSFSHMYTKKKNAFFWSCSLTKMVFTYDQSRCETVVKHL